MYDLKNFPIPLLSTNLILIESYKKKQFNLKAVLAQNKTKSKIHKHSVAWTSYKRKSQWSLNPHWDPNRINSNPSNSFITSHPISLISFWIFSQNWFTNELRWFSHLTSHSFRNRQKKMKWKFLSIELSVSMKNHGKTEWTNIFSWDAKKNKQILFINSVHVSILNS